MQGEESQLEGYESGHLPRVALEESASKEDLIHHSIIIIITIMKLDFNKSNANGQPKTKISRVFMNRFKYSFTRQQMNRIKESF